jgi:CobQ-like glutamine amidotransferase family enzyme
MNIYGDHGNLLVLARRCQWRGIEVETIGHHPGAVFPEQADIILGGGGQDSGQGRIQADLPRIQGTLTRLVEDGVPALVVCGTYQLFGTYFKTIGGETIEGLGIFDLHTVGGKTRLIGNIVTHSSEFGEIIGYENHSGQTWLGTGMEPLARVVSGAGNNGQDGLEGARYKNALGTYLHGPLLPKNPRIADFLIQKALERRSGTLPLAELDEALAHSARQHAKERPR